MFVDISGSVAAVAHRNFYSEVEHSSFSYCNILRPRSLHTTLQAWSVLHDFGLIAVVRQQFVLGINYSTFLYPKSFGANQRLVLIRKSFRVAVQQV